jgi:hypothetical protein
MRYRKLPVEIEAIEYQREENIMAVQDFFGDGNGRELLYDEVKNEYFIRTLEGDMYLTKGDFIIRGVKGEYYPCKPDIFAATYEAVSGEEK